MKVGLVLPMATSRPTRVLEFARRAEELGYDGLFAFDHLFAPGAAPDRPSLEAFTTLAAVASVTSRAVIGTLVSRASLRSAGGLAKQAAALDDIGGGRFVLGLGAGDAGSRAEHEVFGLPYLGPGVRRNHLEETILAVRALFRGEAWEGGDHVTALAGPLLPPPRSPAGPPVWIGGTSVGAVRAAARLADAWNGWAMGAREYERRVALLREESAASGRVVEPTWGGAVVVGEDATEAGRLLQGRADRGVAAQVWAGDIDGLGSWLDRLRGIGASWAILLPAGAGDRMELIGERVLPFVRSRT